MRTIVDWGDIIEFIANFLQIDWFWGRRWFWIFAFACVCILLAVAAMQSANGSDTTKTSVLALLAVACGFASALIAWRRKV
jgi:hypothetical protein